jgi:bifunctional DNA-binding transcriptional regulator/antitoxin component of YhaV-PrlF toxin-antitoxin module
VHSSETPTYTTFVQETENGDIVLEFPDEILDTVGWREGDTLEFASVGNSIRITKVASAIGGGAETP